MDAAAFPEMVPGEELVVSATLFGNYLQCPDRALAQVEGHYGPPSVASFKGGLAHRLFARHLTEGEIAPQDMEQVMREEIGGNSMLNRDMGELTREGELSIGGLKRVFGEAEELYDRFRTYPQEGFREAELFVEYELPGNVLLRGRVDACFDGGEGMRLVDWKTGELGDAARQLLFYALVWTLERGVMPGLVEAVSLRTGEQLSEEVTEEDLGRTAGLVARLVNEVREAAVEERRLLRRPGPLCPYCPILDSCPEGRSAVEAMRAGRA